MKLPCMYSDWLGPMVDKNYKGCGLYLPSVPNCHICRRSFRGPFLKHCFQIAVRDNRNRNAVACDVRKLGMQYTGKKILRRAVHSKSDPRARHQRAAVQIHSAWMPCCTAVRLGKRWLRHGAFLLLLGRLDIFMEDCQCTSVSRCMPDYEDRRRCQDGNAVRV